ncbi:hypothetical protein OROMI_005113 [Orobanche minor]
MPSQEILKIRDGTPLEAEEILTHKKSSRNGSVCHFFNKLDYPSNIVQKERVARILFFKIRSFQEILKICDGTHLESFQEIHDGTPLESEEILTYIKKPQNESVWHFSSKLYVHSNVVQKKRVARILFFKIRPSQEILKIRDGTPLEAEEILTHKKSSRNGSVWHFFNKLDDPSNIVQKERVARILFFKIRSFQEILKIHDGTPLESEEILTYIKKPPKQIEPSQEILKIRDGTPLEAEEILTHKKSSRNGSVWHFFNKLDDPSNIVQKERVARILFFKIRSFQEILKICDGTHLESEEILTYIKKPPKQIEPSQEILKIRDGTPLEAEEILTHKKSSRNGSVWHFFNKLDDPSNIVQKERVARILFFKIRSFQEILKICDGTHLESEEILTYIKKPPKQIEPSQEILKIRDGTPLELDDPSNIVQKERVAQILFFKIRSFQEILKIHDGTPLESEEILTYIKKPPKQVEILKIHDGTPLESEEILTYIKKPPKQIGMALSSKLYVPNNVVHKKRVAWILFFKIRPSQEILKIRDGTHLDSEEILTYIKKLSKRIEPSQEILKIRDGTPLEAEEILTHKKSSRNGSVWHFFNKLDDPSNIVQKERVARILFFKIRSFQEILKICDGTHLESEEILTYIKKPPKQIVARILFFKIRPSQEILKIRDGTPLELDDPSNIVQKERVAQILFFKIRSFQEILKIHDGTPLESEEILTYIKKPPKQVEILKIHDGTPLESEEILTYIKKPPKQIGMALSSKLYVPNNVVHKKRVAWILFFKIRPSQEILKIRDGTHLDSEEILTYIKKLSKRIEPSQEILKIRDGTPLEAEEILTHKKSSRNGSVWHFFNKLDDPSNIVQKERVARILFFKIRSFQEILKICDGTHLESKRVARILFFKIRPSQEILKIRDGTPLEAEEILTHKKSSRNGSERVAQILFFKIRSFQEILKIHDGTPLESEEILTYIKKPPKQVEILKIHDGTPLESEEILTYIKKPPKQIGMALSSKLYVPNNVVHKKRVAWILFFKIRPSQEILKIRDGTHLDSEEILTYIKKLSKRIEPSQEILKIRDGTPLEAEEILTHKKSSRNGSVWHFFNKLDDPSNIVQKERVARILFFKIRSFQEILKICDGTHLESEEILTYIKKPPKQIEPSQEILKIRDGTPLELDDPSNIVQKERVAQILFFKIRSFQEILKIHDGTPLESEEILTYIKKPPKQVEILKIHDGTPLESEEILTYIKKPPKQIGMALSSKLYVPNNVVHKKRVAWILFFKIRPSQEILKIRDGTHLDSEEILTYIKKLSKRIEILKIHDGTPLEPSQEILKIRDGTPLEAEEILTHKKSSRNGSVWHFFNKLDDPSNIVQKERVARILFFKIRSFQEILKIHDGTPLESEEILTYIKKPRKQIGMALSSKLYVPNNVVHKKRVAWILFFKIRSFQEILKIHDGTPLESEEILTYIKKPPKRIVARILFFKIRPSQEILKVRDGTPLEAEEILTHKKSSRNGSVWHFFNKLYDPSNIVQKERVARIIFFKIRSFQEILKICDGTHLESEEILTYIKKPPKQIVFSKWIGMALFNKLDDPSNIVQKERVARILFFKIRSFQEILKIHDGTPLESEEILTYIKKPPKQVVARIIFFKIRSFQEILKIHDGTPLESEEILTYIKKPPKQIGMALSSELDVPNNVVQNKRVAWILCFKIRPSQEILKIRDGTPLEAEEILTQKSSRNGSVWHFFNKLDDPSNIVQKEIVARILFFKIRSFQEILKICDGTHLESEEILTYIKKPTKQIV